MSRVMQRSQAVQAFVLASSLLLVPLTTCEANTATLRADELFQPAQWRDTRQRQEVYDGDVVILSDGQRLVGRLQQIPSIDYSFGSVDFEPDEVASLSFGRVHGLPKMQVITREGYNFIGNMPKGQLQFEEDVEDPTSGKYSSVKRPLDPYDVNYVVLEPSQEPSGHQEKFFHVSLKNGDEVSVLLSNEAIHLTDGWHDQDIPSDSLSRVCFNGGLHGYYEGQEGDETLGFAFVKDSHLNMRLAKDQNLLRMPWTQIDSVHVDLGDFRPDMHQLSWVKEGRELQGKESVFAKDAEPEAVALEAPLSVMVNDDVGQDVFVEQEGSVLSDRDEMMYIPAGSYMVVVEGGDPSQNLLPTRGSPTVQVDLPAYYTDKHPVTNKQYAAFVAATGHSAPSHWEQGRIPLNSDSEPVVNVSYQDAADYANWLGRRLPSEMEWQRAAAEANAIIAQTEARKEALQKDQALSLLSFLTGIEPAQAAVASRQVRFAQAHQGLSGPVAEWTSSDVNGGSAGSLNQMKALYRSSSRYADHKVVRTGFVGHGENQPFPPRWRLHQNDHNIHTGFRTVCNAD